MSRSVQETRPITVSAESGESVAVSDELARTWKATVTSDPAATSPFLDDDVITAGLEYSSPSGTTAKPHGRTATPLESCPLMTGCRTAASTGAYATIASHELVQLLSCTIHLPPCWAPADDEAA